MIELEKPKMVTADISDDGRYGKFVWEPLERGYGITLGNSLRRVLLSSLPGAAVTSVKIEGVLHEFSTIPGVREDVADIILNIKGLCLKLHGDEPKVLRIECSGEQKGTAANIIPEEAILQGTIRTNDNAAREKLVRRMKEVAQKTAEVYNGSAEIEMISEVPPLICDTDMTNEIVGFMKELDIPGLTPYPDVSASASEDFAVIAEKIPSTFMYLSAGYMDERGEFPAHHPKARFNEDVCPIGSACLAHCAVEWLKKHK